jgi:tetratricopeptide (TPR) repeat protein
MRYFAFVLLAAAFSRPSSSWAKFGGGTSGDQQPQSGTAAAAATGASSASSAGGVDAKATDATGLTPAAVAQRYQGFSQAGDWKSAAALAQSALTLNPDDQNMQALAEQARRRAATESSVNRRAQELVAELRGDAGAPPPGAAIEASPLAFATSGSVSRGLPPVLSAAALGARGAAASAPAREAAAKLGIGDFAGAEALLTRRLAENGSDEYALRLRALARRQLKRFEPSAEDARAALVQSPEDSRARRVLIDDLVDLGRPQEALEIADASLRERPNDAQVLAARASARASLGDRDGELADLKQAAALDSQFDRLYEQAARSAPDGASRRPRSFMVWLGAIGTALLFFSFALFRRRGDSSVRVAMRAEDRASLARGGRPDPAPQGFRIERTLGQGGMGVVYEAVDLALQRPVALKKLRAEIADNPRERARFLKEARTVAALRHPNIVAIHSIHEDAEGLFLVFEKVAGETLHERLAAGLTPAETIGYLRQVAKALDHAHARGVVHQDLKPANVMVAGDEAKVMDFGIARRVAETLSTMSKIEIVGTPAYMAPEQELGQSVGPATDVYALGVCAYELLAGRRPFPDGGGLMMKTRGLYRPASEAGAPAAVDAPISRALALEPGARWPSASAFVDALARALAAPV